MSLRVRKWMDITRLGGRSGTVHGLYKILVVRSVNSCVVCVNVLTPLTDEQPIQHQASSQSLLNPSVRDIMHQVGLGLGDNVRPELVDCL